MGGQPDVLATLLSSGPVGVILVAILMGWIVTKPHVVSMQATIDRLLVEAESARERERAAMQQMSERVIPVLTQAVEVMREDRDREQRAGGAR